MKPTWKSGRQSPFNLWQWFRNILTTLRQSTNRASDKFVNDELPLRSELFSTEQMEQQGIRLASAHCLTTGHVSDWLLLRLADNEGVLVNTCNRLIAIVAANNRVSPAGEWLLDNFHLIEEQIRTARHHLPKGYNRELPTLADGASSGLPRVYDIALETIAHSDGRVDLGSLTRFVAAYQTIAPLTLGELWAIPIMLRLALLENLRRIAIHISFCRNDVDLAIFWANNLTEIAWKDPKNLILIIADMARSKPPMSTSFVAELARRLQGQGPALALALTWIQQQLAESGLNIEQLVHAGNRQQAADQVSISNSIGSLRLIGAIDWREFVESMSVVERILRTDPAACYVNMDFTSRNCYRDIIEEVAKAGKLPEYVVAQRVIELAQLSAAQRGNDDRSAHIGFYLLNKGRDDLERAIKIRRPLVGAWLHVAGRSPLLLYLGTFTLITLTVTASLFMHAFTDGAPHRMLPLLLILLLLTTSQLATTLVNWLTTWLALPDHLPRMDFSAGIPPESRTLVVIPCMLSTADNIDTLVEALEVRFLANRDGHLHFGLLTDFSDANEASMPDDVPLLALARKHIEDLNSQYAHGKNDLFYLFHRPRRWNAPDLNWIGYERKRGKLAALNNLLHNGCSDEFSLVVGATAVLNKIKYVITLDSDTQLPRDVARQLVGTMAHPLNRPVYDATLQRVIAGYGILQPRVSMGLPDTRQSRYARLYGGEPGIDPYTRAVSDVYQDAFQEGSFIGKGIYDVGVFEHTLKERFPENRILSHDLLEGCYVRSGLLSDIQLYEEYPARYDIDTERHRRWIRGDWQIAGWLLPRVPDVNRIHRRNTLSLLSRWKLFDNLLRSMTPAGLLLLLLSGWIIMISPLFWTVVVVGIMLAPSLLASLMEVFGKPNDMHLVQHVSTVAHSAGQRLLKAGFTLAMLPYESFYSMDAIIRTWVRLLITQQHLLEWRPYNNQTHQPNSLLSSFRIQWFAPALAIGTGIYLATALPSALAVAAPILLLWLASPVIAWWISLPIQHRDAQLSTVQLQFLGRISRKTWAFFENFVGPDDNWLPPDNYQEYRAATLAHRTSPTNIGLALLANLSAYDFGYITAGQCLERIHHSLETMAKLERHLGHFFNWYDTQTLQPLRPTYISTVDSGNLAGHLLTLRPGLLALADQPIVNIRCLDGLRDTLTVLEYATAGNISIALMRFRTMLNSTYAIQPTTLPAVWQMLTQLAQSAQAIANRNDYPPESEAAWWINALFRQCQTSLDELVFLAPWLTLPEISDVLDELPEINLIPTLHNLAEMSFTIANRLDASPIHKQSDTLDTVHQHIDQGSMRAQSRITETIQLALQAREFANMEYAFLYDKASRLMHIGYNVDEHRLDASFYDLLASEVRLCIFVAIAQEKLPQDSWFALGRQLTKSSGEPTLLSWSGSMFEYLMPQLVMPTYDHTLLEQSAQASVARQIEYGQQRGLPWGISESGYNVVDIHLNYQYRAFGVPGLGLKRGLAEDLVIAPYATMLALMVKPEAACANLQRLSANKAEGRFGFYEAIDYTPIRQRRNESQTLIRSYMAHHQGMGLLALSALLLDRPMQKRFVSDPLFQATLLLLQERIPKASAYYVQTSGLAEVKIGMNTPDMPIRVLDNPDTLTPEVQLLSNSRYHLMITSAGGGYSRWNDLALTRWHEDSTCDPWGTYCYLRDVGNNTFWSATHQPVLRRGASYQAIFSEGRAEFRRRDGYFDTHTDIVVSPEDDIELRRMRITNISTVRRTIELTSYAEVVLAPPAADTLHPAFSKLFVQTEIIEERHAILCTRRSRSHDEQTPSMFHLIAIHDADVGKVTYETDRARFLGRGRTATAPQVMDHAMPLSNSQGSVLDPIVAIRCQINLDPGESVNVDLVMGIGEDRESAMTLIEKYQDRHLADRVFGLAWTHAQVVLRQINASEADAQLYSRLANTILYAHASLRADSSILIRNRRGQSGLWGYAISGDLPIVLLRISTIANMELVRQMIQAHAYWRLKGLAVDLVIWNEDHAGYRQALQDLILNLVSVVIETQSMDRPGGIFIRLAEHVSEEDRTLFLTVARVIIDDMRGTLAEQINAPRPPEIRVPRLIPSRALSPALPVIALPQRELILPNVIGGFTPDGREYVITTTADQLTPAPWANVLANPNFGSIISESGQAYTWSENAHEFRLTPWHNDPVSDTSGEAIYLRDQENGHFWSPTPLPRRGATPYISRHGFGYSVFEHIEDGISSELWIYVAIDAAVKFSVLKVHNISGRTRRLSATGYVEWVLGDLRQKSIMHITTEIDPYSGTLFASNPYNAEFPDRVAFFDVDDPNRTTTCDRAEFIGRNGSLHNPAALSRTHLSGKRGAGLDPCAAIQVNFDLNNGQKREITFRLGLGGTPDNHDVSRLVHRFRGADAARRALEAVWQYWRHTLDAIRIETPDQSLNVLTNGWLLYQTQASRMWARSGYYQSGGAFGFRDQLQDAMSLVHSNPLMLRTQLLLCAGRQFIEGDVQHWWHPPSGRGVRTHCSDDYLWLALATCRYVLSSGDTGVLDEPVPFLEGRPLSPEDDSYFDLPGHSTTTESLYQHCVRAIKHGLRMGAHGLPLIGSGDWNDGMNRVGIQGKGESVWLGFFLYQVLDRFGNLAQRYNDLIFSEFCATQAHLLGENLEQHGWDGHWYLRAWFDDGTPLGSASSSECRIDSIAQSWAVLSGAGERERARIAMQSLDEHLVSRHDQLIRLLVPPFDHSDLDPGYIMGYVPGVRENGGQYTHAAIWAAMAFAAMGDGQRAWELTTIINPANHANSPESIARYKVEPYVMAADVYGEPPHIGRGGWTWYTGSAGWMYRLIVESLLGLQLETNLLHIAPVLPAHWDALKIHYRYRETFYHIAIAQTRADTGNPKHTPRIIVDGVEQEHPVITLMDDRQDHVVAVYIQTPN